MRTTRMMLTIGTVLAAGAAAGQELTATVRVFKHARLPRETFEQAAREVRRIFRWAGVELELQDCPWSNADTGDKSRCANVPNDAGLALRIAPRPGADRLPRRDGQLGFALDFDAYVFFDRIRLFCGQKPELEGVLLGHVMAHELRHMILGPGHTRAGIMSAEFRQTSMEQVSQRRLFFNPAQAESMRTHLMRRIAGERAKEQAPVAGASVESPKPQ